MTDEGKKQDPGTEEAVQWRARMADLEKREAALSLQVKQLQQALSDARHQEDQYRQSEKKYRDIIANMEDGYCEMDLAGRITYYNEALQKMVGYTREELLTMGNRGYTTPETARNIFQEFNEMYRTGRPLKMKDYEIIRKDGSVCTVEFSSSLMRDEVGRPSGSISIVRDISDKKKVEQSLRESKEHFRALFDRSLDGVYIYDFNGYLIDVNPTVLDALKCKKEELSRLNVVSFLTVDQTEAATKMVEELQRRGYQKRPTELKLTLKDGRQFYAETKESVIYRDGKPHAILGIARDITERKHAEENLRKSEEKYRRIIENIDEGYSETTMDGVLLFCNESFCRIFGYSREELRTMCFRDFAAPEDAGRLFNAFREMYRSGMPLTMENYNVVHKDGSIRRLEMTASVMHDAAGTPIGARSMLRDVTQRKTSDEEREKLKKQLFQAQKLEAIGTLAGGIAHDFNNILASIMGYTELAMRDTLKEKRKKYLSQVLNSCERARNLIQHILTFSRQQEQERKPVDIKAIIKESLKMLRSSLPTTIQIEQKIDAPSSTVFADPTELHQIMMNLCTNAAHAMRAKNGTLKILLNNIAITQEMLSLNPDFQCGPHIQLTVGDTGHGIDPSIMDMIFDPFFTTKKQEEGTGLGLSVVYGIVKRYNGVITVQSDVGEGTIFNIYLPVVVEELPVREEIKDAAKLEGTGRILIVDDEEMLLLINQTFLSSLGYDVVAATGGQEALRLFAEDPGRYDLIITDMTMPQMTGMALSREVMAIRPDIPVILCTGYNESIIEEEAKAQGVKAFFMKPISLNALGRMVQQLLDR